MVQKRYKGEEYIVTFTVKEKNETIYAPKGHEVKHHQVVLKPNTLKIEREENTNKVNINEEDKLITLSTEKHTMKGFLMPIQNVPVLQELLDF